MPRGKVTLIGKNGQERVDLAPALSWTRSGVIALVWSLSGTELPVRDVRS